MSFICTDNECINVDAEVGSKEWEQLMKEQGICEHDRKIIEEFVNKIYSME